MERIPQASQGKARDEAAKLTGVNPHYITDAKKIQATAPEVLEAVKHGAVGRWTAPEKHVRCNGAPHGAGKCSEERMPLDGAVREA